MQSLAEAPLPPRSLALCVLVVSEDNAREEIKNNAIYKLVITFTNISDAYFFYFFFARHNPSKFVLLLFSSCCRC